MSQGYGPKIGKKGWVGQDLLVDPGSLDGVVGAELLGLEPQGNLLLGRFDSVGAVANVTADLDAEVASDGAGLAVSRVGLAQHHTAGLHGVQTLPHHGDDGAAGHVLDKSGEEGLLGEVSVVGLQKLLTSLIKKVKL